MATTHEMLLQAFEQHRTGHLAEADELYRQVLAADPKSADAWHLRGAVALANGDLANAIAWFTQATTLAPDEADFHNNLGIALRVQGQLQQAVQSHQRAVECQSGHGGAHYGLGLALSDLQRPVDAQRSFERAVELSPHVADFHSALGHAHLAQGNHAAAETCLRRALELQRDHGPALFSLAGLCQLQNRWDEAVGHYRETLRIAPNNAAAQRHLAAALQHLQRYDEAAEGYQRLVELQPDDCDAWNKLGILRQRQGLLDEAYAAFRQAIKGDATCEHNLLFAMAHDPRQPPAEIAAAHTSWGQRYASLAAAVSHNNSPDLERRLRIGYVSGDFCRHAVARFFEPLLVHHDTAQVHVVCFSNVARPDRMTDYLQSLSHTWHTIFGLDDERVVELVRSEQIDLLVDLSGHTAGNRLMVFARKPAPVQVTYLGYPCTTGLTAIDYRLSDAVFDPHDEPAHGSEEVVCLPRGFNCFQPSRTLHPVAPLPALAAGHITFGSLHKLTKINAQVIDLWSRLLHAVPHSRLLMLRDTLVGATAETYRRHFVERGIAAERLDFRSQASAGSNYLTAYHEIDIALDTFPYAGGTTSTEALWMGAPVLTLRGDRPVGRAGAALMHFVGHHEFIAESLDDYVARGVRLAADLRQLAAIRAGLRDRFNASYGDCRAFTRTLEDAYRQMWRRWCAAQGS